MDYVVQTTYKLDDQVSAGAVAATASLNKLADAADKAASSTDAVTKTTERVGPSYDSVNRKIDESAALTAKLDAINRKYTQGLAAVRAEADAGGISAEQLADKESRLAALRDQQATAANRQAAALATQFSNMSAALNAATSVQAEAIQRTHAQTEALSAAALAQSQYNSALGVMSNSSANFASRAADIEAYGTALDRLRAKYNPLFAVSKEYENSLNEIAQAEKVGAITANEAVAATDRLTQAFAAANQPLGNHVDNVNRVTTSSGNAAFAQRQFGVQSVQLFSSIASGQPILTSFIQQGHQMLDVALSTGTGFGVVGSAIKSALAAIISPIGLAIGAVVAFSAAVFEVVSHSNEMASESRSLQTAIDGVGRSAGTSSAQLQAYATQLAHTSDLSKAAATAAIAQATRTPGITSDNIGNITALAPNLGAALGIGTAEAVKQLTDAYTGNYTAIQKLMAASNDFTLAQVIQVRHFLEVGDKASALKLIIDQLSTSMHDADKNSLTPMGQAFRDLGAGWDDFMTRVSKYPMFVAAMNAIKSSAEGAANALRDSTMSELQAQLQSLQKTNEQYPSMGLMQIKKVQDQIAALNTKSAAVTPAIPGGGATSQIGASIYSDYTNPTTAQSQAIDKLNKSLQEQNEVLSASLPTRAAVAAGQKAYDDTIANGLGTYAAAKNRLEAMATAQRQAGDAAVQEAAAQDRATTYALKMTDAIHASAVAALQAAAAQEAHEKAVTQAGVSEATYTRVLLNRSAAQALQAGAQQTVDLQNQLALSNNIAQATDAEARHQAELSNAVIATTRAMTDKAQASQNPAIITAVQAEVDKQRQLGLQLDANNTKVSVKQSLETNAAAVAVIDAELTTLTATDAERNRAIALIQEMNREKATGLTFTEAEKKALQDSTIALADKQSQLQRFTADVNEVGNAVDQIANNISQALSNAFISGQGAAVNFGNVVRGVLSSILTEIAKLAIINPILNSVVGGSYRATLSGVSGFVGGGTGGASGASLSSLASLASSGSSLSGALGGPTIGSSLGLTGPGGVFTGAGSSIGGYFTNAGGTGLLNLGITGSTTMAGTNAAIAAMGGGLYGPALPSAAAGASGVGTLGMFAGGIGGGFAAGSLVGMGVQSLTNKTGPAPEIGAAGGAIAGAIIGSVVPVIGTVLGGIIGGIIGGGGGGFIGPGPKHSYTSTGLTTDGGQFNIGRTVSQGFDPTGEVQALQTAVTTLNQTMASAGLTVSGSYRQIGQNTPGGYIDPTKSSSLDAALGNYKFTSATDANLTDKLAQQVFGSVGQFQQWVTAYQAAEAATKSYLTDTTTLMSKFGKTSGSLNDTIASLNEQMDASIASAELLKNSGYLSTDQVNQLIKAEADLNSVRAQAIQKITDEANQAIAQQDAGFNSRYLNATAVTPADALNAQLYAFDVNATNEKTQFKAQLTSTFGDAFLATQDYANQMAMEEKALGAERLKIQQDANKQIAANDNARIALDANLQGRYLNAAASISGSPQDAEKAQLYNFDQGLQPQRDAFSAQLVTIYGQAFTTTADYAQEMLAEERTFGEERLAIIQSYNDKATQTASATIISLQGYLSKLQTGSASPLSPTAQLSLAEQQFAALSAKAKSGDFSALGQISGSADTLLAASKSVFGSGAGYVTDFNKVLEALSSLSDATPDTLTASVFAVETKTQTQVLAEALAAVKAEIVALRLQVQQTSNTPAQIAA